MSHDVIPAPTSGLGASDPEEARTHRDKLLRMLTAEMGPSPVLDALARVPRHLFAPFPTLSAAYRDGAATIGHGQTISQPYVVAVMTAALELTGRERVLEIGTGSGYQAALLSLLAAEVYSMELVEPLAVDARARLAQLGYSNVHVRTGDGYAGWPDAAPFDRIMITAAPDEVPRTLFEQLADDGVLVAPVGPVSQAEWAQRLLRYRKSGSRLTGENLGAVRFVPMVRG